MHTVTSLRIVFVVQLHQSLWILDRHALSRCAMVKKRALQQANSSDGVDAVRKSFAEIPLVFGNGRRV
jgi:hypothetical protein